MPTSIHFLLAVSVWTRLRHLGGVGLILLGLADNSVVPLPGSMDVLTIYLAARHRDLWWYYAFMATVGAVIGGYITYGLARKGGKEAFERKLSKKKAEKVFARFERWGFAAVAVPAFLPPPFPIVPFLLAAGALQYSRKKFVAALALGRAVRFIIVAGLGAIYGRHIVRFFSQYYKPALMILIGLAVVGGVMALIQYYRYKNRPLGDSGEVSVREKTA
ncbi:MAG TPA: VTT domain-containing protein [Terriglobales bacterium]|jgi:membrane protein YqaA with SNARE-associated domain|nr:VTT domain-containing protein [Terriglobales bacterium]